MSSVDIIVPVHNTRRPIERAVSSILASRSSKIGVLVVCHNVSRFDILKNLKHLTQDTRLRVIEYWDGKSSAAGPRNYAIDYSDADYLGFLDSDDEYEPDALDTWVSELSGNPDLLIGQLSSDGVGRIAAPCPRGGVFDGLNAVRDLLNYRTAPVGVLARRSLVASVESPKYREGFRVGEDIALGAFLWNYATHIAYSRSATGYRIRADGDDRVTGEGLSVEEILSPIRDVVSHPSIRALSRRKRQALGVKLLRHQVIEFIKGRLTAGLLDHQIPAAVAYTVRELLSFAPGSKGFFDFCDARLIRALQESDFESAAREIERADTTPHQLKAIPTNPLRTFAPEALLVRARRTRRLRADWDY